MNHKLMQGSYYYFFKIAILLAFLFHIRCSVADILDGGEVRFQGYVIDDGPRWLWAVSSPAQSWTTDINDALKVNGNLVFKPATGIYLPFLEGHLKKVADTGGIGLSPEISFSSSGQILQPPDSQKTNGSQFKLDIPVFNSETGNHAGTLGLTINQALSASFGLQENGASVPSGMSLLNGESVELSYVGSISPQLIPRLEKLLRITEGMSNENNTTNIGVILPQMIVKNGNVNNIAMAYSSVLSDFNLIFPEDKVPANWEAQLCVTVTVN
ncbi:Fimbrial, major and minor subunit [Citrobacter freundii]|nr:Fimbrial, major and minor subunit [Citrobacter freundii]